MTEAHIDLSDFEGTTRIRQCKLARIFADLDEQHQRNLQAALDKESISLERIKVALRGWGYDVSNEMIRKHRNGVCSCAR